MPSGEAPMVNRPPVPNEPVFDDSTLENIRTLRDERGQPVLIEVAKKCI